MIGLFGTGVLRDAVASRVDHRVGQIAGCAAVAVVSDSWDTRPYPEIDAACRAEGVPWLPVRVELGTAVIGPFGGCFTCAEIRRRRIGPEGYTELLRRHGEELADRPSPALHPPAAEPIAALVVAELDGPVSDSVWHVDLDTMRVRRHEFLRDPRCRRCGTLPGDSAELATITPRRLPKVAPGRFRLRELGGLDSYVDPEYGLVRAVELSASSPVPRAKAYLRNAKQPEWAGYGRTRDFASARATAIAEALERHAAVPGGKRTVVRASLRELGEDALDPRALGLYPDDWYDRPGFPYQRFTDDLRLSWVWGYSFGRAKPVLVPEEYAYYGLPQRLACEVSNGCALGSCVEEAILHAVLELVERDAFLMTWLGRLRLPRIDVESAHDREIPLLVDHIETTTGYRVRAIDTTMEHGIPSVAVFALSDAEDRPLMLCAAGAHFRAESALRNALYELAPAVHSAVTGYAAARERSARLAADSSLVRELDDHRTTYFHPSTRERFDFLFGGETRPLTAGWPEHDDLADDLAELVSRFPDVVVVDQTTSEHRRADLACVKAIVPGLVPMTFGHHVRRVHGLPRLPADLNPHPHPFA